ncbi:Mur ligase family protein [Halovivax gelatinilyticus]|uniref:Mur ligase family protein n=1 Tax=Halovivax gelatinilyticus TaxID=2961597 RepID=UPI0020CA541A|nr:Mur ligase family protein [Halovivax gelatinilyticus]
MNYPPIDRTRDVVTTAAKRLESLTPEIVRRGSIHRSQLAEADVRIVVSGTRGKSGMTRRIHDVLCARGYDTYAKITGNHPLSVYNGEEHPIERGERVTLYENASELRSFGPTDALVLENQGITDYTTRLMNETFGHPDVFVITNVRQDHRDTLGGNRAAIARSFARAVPRDTCVVNGERDPELRAYLERELDYVGASVRHVDVPDEHRDIPGAEVVYGIDEVLQAIGEPALSDPLRESLLDDYRVEWIKLPRGRVFNAASVNDVESTEMIRRALVEDDEVVQPLLYLREDRRARTASFHTYLAELHRIGAIEQARVVGSDAELFAEKSDVPVIVESDNPDHAGSILESALDDGWPVLIMGNTVASFMRALEAEIDQRSSAYELIESQRSSRSAGPDDRMRADATGSDEIEFGPSTAARADDPTAESGVLPPSVQLTDAGREQGNRATGLNVEGAESNGDGVAESAKSEGESADERERTTVTGRSS